MHPTCLSDVMPLMSGLTGSIDSDADSMPSLRDSDSGLDDSMVSIIGDHDDVEEEITVTLRRMKCKERSINILMAQATVTRSAALDDPAHRD